MLHDLGEWDELLRVAEEVRQVEAEHGPAQPGAMSQTYAALVLIRRGAVDDAAMLAADVLARARAMEEPQVLAPSLVVSALVEEAQGNSGAALTHVDEYRLLTRSRPYFRAQNLTDAVRVACASGDVALAESLLDNLVTAAEWDRLAALAARATIAEAREEFEDAKAAFSEAAEGWKALGCVFEHALALRGAGEDEAANAILEELGVPLPPAQTAARTAK
jgi:response regulator RpfG family c-di-GMP phosphodiesterase